MIGPRVLIKGALLFLLALIAFPASAQAAWPSIPSDEEINEAAQRFIQETNFERELQDCDAIADMAEREVCRTKRSMNTWFGPQITYRGQVIEASYIKIHHTAQPDPLIANAVVLLYTQQNWHETISGEKSTSLSYETAILEYGSPQSDRPGWHFVGSRWWSYDQADLDQSLPPRELRNAKVELLFRPLDERGYYGWARGFRQNLTVTGYNGETDPTRMPMTFWIKLEDEGKPVKGAPISFEVEGEVKCLADKYAVWDPGARKWTEEVHNFAAGPVSGAKAPLTGSDGMVIVRLFLDYGRMRLFKLQLPCTLDFTAYAPTADDVETFQKAETTLEIISPAFVRSVLYQLITREGATTRQRVFNVTQLRDWYAPLIPTEDRFGLNPTPTFEEPTQARVLSRISLGGKQLSPPPGLSDYFIPIKPGDQLIIDASSQPLPVADGQDRSWVVRHGDGIGVSVMWLDGSEGIFTVNNRTPQWNSVLAMRVKDSWSTTEGMPLSDEKGLALFVVNQGVDFVIKTAVVGGATAVGGPVAGAWAAVIVDGVQTVNDASTLADLAQRNRRVIWLRSLVSLTSDLDGLSTLYVFEGSPGVEDNAGGEVAVGVGQAVEFALDGEISPPRAQEPPPLAQAMIDALPAAAAPAALSIEEAASVEAAPAQDQDADDFGWLSADMSEDILGDLPAGLTDALGGDLGDFDWGVALGVGAATMAVVVVLGMTRRGKRRRAQTVTAQDGAFAIQPAATSKTAAKAPASPRRTRAAKSSTTASAAATKEQSAPAPPAKPRKRSSFAPATEPDMSPEASKTAPPEGALTAAPEKAGTPAPVSSIIACPRCGQLLRAGVRFCGRCGAKLEEPAEVPPPPEEPRCPQCQAPVRPGARFCGTCGHALDA